MGGGGGLIMLCGLWLLGRNRVFLLREAPPKTTS